MGVRNGLDWLGYQQGGSFASCSKANYILIAVKLNTFHAALENRIAKYDCSIRVSPSSLNRNR